MPNFIHFSDTAVLRMHELFEKENNPKLKARFFIVGGGCSGFQYGFQFDEVISDDDTLLDEIFQVDEKEISIPCVSDPLSVQYLEGANINYIVQDGEEEGYFSIRNPNIMTGCPGCASAMPDQL